jgi:hypothetical protein
MLLLLIYTCGAAAGVIAVSSAHDTSDSSVSISMPVQYSMAAPAYASGQLAAVSLTSVPPSYKTVTTTERPSQSEWIPKQMVQPSQPVPNYTSQMSVSRAPQNRRMTFSAGYAASEPQFDSHNEYEPHYHQKSPSYSTIKHYESPIKHYESPTKHYESPIKHYESPKIRQPPPPTYQPYISYTPPPSYLQYHEPYIYTKPYFPKHLSHNKPVDNDLLDFPVYSHKGSLSGSSSSYYKYMFPIALLGISLPAIGLMYTYLSRRRRRDLRSDLGNYFRPSEDDLQYYLNILQSSIQRFQDSMDNELIVKESRRRVD